MKQPPLPKPDVKEVEWDEWDKAVTNFGELEANKAPESYLILREDAATILADSLHRQLKIKQELAYLVARICIADLVEKQ
jgi:hypothetical protein